LFKVFHDLQKKKMKRLALLLFIPLSAFSQQISNQQDIKPYQGDFGDIYFINDNEQILTTSSFEGSFLLNAKGEKVKELDIIKNGESSIHPNGKKIGIMGTQYYDKPNKKMYATVLQIVDVASGDVQKIMFENNQIQRFNFHPTNDNLIAAIMMDENFEYQSVIMDISEQKVLDVCLQGKGSFIPLTNDFTKDGKYLICGYGNSSYNGGFTYYDLEAKKELRRISLKDQPLGFLELDDKFIMRGNKSLIVYSKDWIAQKTINHRMAAIHPNGKFAIHFNQEKEALFVDLTTGEKTKLDIPLLKDQDFSNVSKFYGYARFSPDGRKLAVKFFKWNKFKEIKMPDKPSFMTFDLTF
jgi:hypothetical protein